MRLVAHQSIRAAHLGEAYLLAGRINDATRFGGRALDLSRKHKERGHEAWVLRLLGEISSRSDPSDVEIAEGYYRQALALAGELGMRPLVAHCHLGVSKLYRRGGKCERADDHLSTATTMFREMAMPFWLERAEAEMHEVG